MLQNAYLLAKIGADTAENEQHFAKNLRKTDNYSTGPERVGVGDAPRLDAHAKPGGSKDWARATGFSRDLSGTYCAG